jgi:hypothetical protein
VTLGRLVARLAPTLAGAVVAASLVGCGPAAGAPQTVIVATASPTLAGSAAGAPGSGVPPSIVPRSSVPGSAGAAIAIDPALLDLLPSTIGGLDRQTDPGVDAQAFADASLAVIASAGASAVYVDPASGAFAYATILKLRGSTIDDAAFRAYRDSFDAGACSQAAGVAGNAQAVLGGRTTYIATCNGGVRTYHTVLPTAHAILSISSVGANRLGEQLAAATAS